MDFSSSERKRRSSARERQAARNERRQMVTPIGVGQKREPRTSFSGRRLRSTPAVSLPSLPIGDVVKRIGRLIGDAWWYLTHKPKLGAVAAGLLVVIFVFFVLSHLLGGRIFPNVWALGVPIGGLSVDEATVALTRAWQSEIRVTLADGDRTWAVTPAELGLQLDARATADSARGVGMAGIPLGFGVKPAVTLDVLTAQNFLLDMTELTKIEPYNAGYRWESDQLVGVPGSDGRYLDVALTMGVLEADPALVADRKRIELVMTEVAPEVISPEPYLEQARQFTTQPFRLTGYDPLTNEYISWATDRDTLTSWVEAGERGLTLREEAFARFVDAQTASLMETNNLRFIEISDTMEKMRSAIADMSGQVHLRIRYRGTTYEVVSGDTGYRIARKTGLPFYLIEQANPNRDWDALLSPGETINLPPPDVTMPLDPVPNKRIIVDLSTQSLVAYENGEPVFNWAISSGISTAPTSPGVFQILNHDEVALGSSYTLCSATGCGQWQMYWFMGIYEVTPGLVNGFHGAVLLPNGTYLGGGSVGSPYTFGCVMSTNENAELLYRWADEGTVVEIISSEFTPKSDLGLRARQDMIAFNALAASIM